MPKAKYDTVQPGGVCWDCGEGGAYPSFETKSTATGITAIGWRCECGRWWPCTVDDLKNWVAARAKVDSMPSDAEGYYDQ